MPAENNLIMTTDMTDAQIRELDFVTRFNYSVAKLIEALGITRKIPKEAGTVLKTYKAEGTLENGVVAEGETIPLSKYKIKAITYKEITLKKWRKATTAESITTYGFNQAVNMTTDEMLRDVQRGIRSNFFTFLGTGTQKTSGANLKKVLATNMGKLLNLFDTDDVAAVHFVNPATVYDYLGDQEITTQTAFGMTYVQNFLGYGTLFMNSSMPKGAVYSTISDNVVLYYIAVNGADLGEAFNFTSDDTGYIGIHEVADYDNLTCKDTVVSGIELFAEKMDGVIVGTVQPASDHSVTTESIPVVTAVEAPADHVYTEEELDALKVDQIKGLAAFKGYTITKTVKAEIIEEFLAAQQA